ncbi:G-type lectin S-receptor-like serine/threonine-protein kinase At2g19130 isoform X1 [Nymphaea colorata]|uniref:Receptor-like serine/threonine-protein kinase n=1 Tax=Nymphaea colorata TaxID=210225 RepID=A0A5K0VZX1_9MAGN|nr:G-type lectin S-receptor-like serine/threonine-protein kinase At2g19130 isoform X1 [Nymphaea colorata]XP_031497401.1 G-type lectin S-receptor-like serine/threonine-protein kinase At2g19130 isoform X1 [Nymphaea colorata]XP_031497409.1 G-type lectin S-receptor-like serine/threonine-protein kinase At2g19130 isoform X1 [Nymphaea colorata]XP_031497418.1 G-type lectin S-receptor-like serine/threonine-protein kinase At2g19130 isoform X1 [Nymphaea colorata]
MGSWMLLPWLRILLCSLLFCCYGSQIFAANTISSGQALTGNQTITSSKGVFELGYVFLGNPKRYYLGIRYKQIPTDNVVWVANRDKPLQDNTAEFKISEDGNLVLLTQSKVISWSTNVTSTPSSPSRIVVLEDSGNLVLRDANSSDKLWDSFSHPTHTWLPGGSLGLNKVTNENQLLTSWKNKEDPSPGPFSLELDPNGSAQYFIVWNRTQQYWTSGVWNNQTFSGVPEMRANYLYNFSFVENDTARYFTYSVYNSSILTKFVIDLSGQIKQLTWVEESQQWIVFWAQPRDQCEVYGLCGDFGVCDQDKQNPCNCVDGFEPASPQVWGLSDWSGGCRRKVALQCERDQFSLQPGLNSPANNSTVRVNNAEGCKSACLEDCSCTAYSYQNSGCLIWKGGLLNLRQQSVGNENSIYVRVSNLETLDRVLNKKNAATVIIGVSVGSVLAILVIIWLLVWIFRKLSSSQDSKMQGMLVSFRYKDLQTATKNFSDKLGGGGFGSVFKGTLPDSSVVAVKKLEGPRQGEKQFRTEVSTIGTIQHVNLVRLRGFCSEGMKRLLVYDFMQNGSLDFHLFNFNSEPLNWRTRYEIAVGTARGISYLHEKCRDCIIHCDIKPENILLDAQFCPKVADFGLAKLLGREFSRVLTTFRGTRGYLAPEWLSGLPITAKADVYSYGMMLLELISGRRNVEHSEDGKVGYFPTWAANKILESEEFALLDPRLGGEADVGELTIACRIAIWCIQDEENSRPSMGQVVQVFEKLLEFGKPPVPRSLQVLVSHQENIVFFSDGSDRSSKLQTTDSSTCQAKSSFSV